MKKELALVPTTVEVCKTEANRSGVFEQIIGKLPFVKSLALHLRKPKPTPILIEGGYPDSWKTHYTTQSLAVLPENCSEIGILSYHLALVGRWGESGIEEVTAAQRAEGIKVRFDPTFEQFISIPQRPTTIITSKGEIYHDLDLLQSEENSDRVFSFLRMLEEKYGRKNPSLKVLALPSKPNQ